MSAQWSQPSLPEDQWYTVPAQGHSTFVQPSGSEWNGHPTYSSASEYPPLDRFAFTNTAHGSVDLGLSPVLSHESQSSHTLNSFPDPDFSVLPPSLDLSFSSDPSWTCSGPVMYNGLQVEQHQLPGNAFVPSPDVVAMRPQPENSTPQWPANPRGFQNSMQPVFCSQGGQVAHSVIPYPTVAPRRPLLPRTEGTFVPTTLAHTHAPSQRPIRPLIQSRVSAHISAQSVSNTIGQAQDSHGYRVGRRLAPSPASSVMQKEVSASAADQSLPRMDAVARSKSHDMLPLVTDPAAEEFNAFIQYDNEEPASNTPALSRATGFAPLSSVASTLSVREDFPPVVAKDEPDAKPAQAPDTTNIPTSGEMDEGRHRNHPLYSQGPMPDGLYHCPFKPEDNCPHKPTKLKCNYDKFIDSHLKPFRCKIETCAKQEFSSTACLLRHEREAHGMHGHGERPHLCYYTGCERGFPGNGFPRRYNLFDHMKRVHDHKEEPGLGLASPDSGSVEASKKATGRKRRAPSPSVLEPVAQRQRTLSHTAPQAPGQVLPMPRQEFQAMTPQVPQAVHYPAHVPITLGPFPPSAMDEHRQRLIHSQWNSQRKLLARQLDYVQSPDDEAGIERFSQDLQELRRLSQEARRG